MTFLFLCFFTNTATTEIYTLSLHDALPILRGDLLGHRRVDPLARRESRLSPAVPGGRGDRDGAVLAALPVRPLGPGVRRSEEHTSELQSLAYLVCRLLLEKKNKKLSSDITR